jgi:hypothetical protein
MFNEGKACDAVIRYIERREKKQRKEIKRPELDKNVPANKRVELTFKIGTRLFALEHTGIEPFPGHIKSMVDSDKLFSPIQERLLGKLPNTELFKLCVSSGVKIRNSQIIIIQEKLANWIEKIAPTLPISHSRIATPIAEFRDPAVPFEASLYRSTVSPMFISHFGGRLVICRMVDASLEAAREIRIMEACEKKYGKLFQCKNEDNARTILIFEENDCDLTNHQFVINAFSKVEENITTIPDEVFLVSTCNDTPWWVTIIRFDDKWYSDFEISERSWEVDPTILIDITQKD